MKTSSEVGRSIVAVINVDSCSANSMGSATSDTNDGSSSLNKLRIAVSCCYVPPVMSPKVNIIVSENST